MRTPARLAASLSLAVLLAACSGDEGPQIETATVRSGQVVQTVAAPARLEPRARATVGASVSGEIVELLVDDGDTVAAGDPVVRLSSEALDEQIEQAQAAVEATEALSGASVQGGVDLAPVLGGFRAQLDALVPGILDGLDASAGAAEAGLDAAVTAVTGTQQAADTWRAALEEAVADLEPSDGPPAADLDLDGLPELDPDAMPPGVGTDEVVDSLLDAQQQAAAARASARSTERSFASASRELERAEAELETGSRQAAASQQRAVEAQVEQAELALEAARSRTESLELGAPIGGVVELVRGDGSGTATDGGGVDLGDAAGALGSSDLSSLLGGAGSAAAGASDGLVAEGAAVTAGQPLLEIYDTSEFRVDAEIDEIDVVDVAVGQPVVVRLDAHPGTVLDGVVEHVAFAPRRDVTGGAFYGVEIALLDVPVDLSLRVGLTASVEIEVRRVDADLVVPTSALLRRGDGEVLRVVRDGVVEEVAVTLTAIGDEDAAVDGALDTGEEVVTTGVELLEDGDEVPR